MSFMCSLWLTDNQFNVPKPDFAAYFGSLIRNRHESLDDPFTRQCTVPHKENKPAYADTKQCQCNFSKIKKIQILIRSTTYGIYWRDVSDVFKSQIITDNCLTMTIKHGKTFLNRLSKGSLFRCKPNAQSSSQR